MVVAVNSPVLAGAGPAYAAALVDEARHARFLTRVHDRIWRAGLAQLTDPEPPRDSSLRRAGRAYQRDLTDLMNHARGHRRLTTNPTHQT